MGKHWVRRTTKTIFLSINILIGMVFLVACLSPYINPNDFWLHGFMSLITPYLILVLIIFILLWLISNPIWALLPLLCLIVGYKQVSVAFAWHGNSGYSKRKSENSIRLVDWNVQSFNGLTNDLNAKKLVRHEVAASILKTHPDIICLQEFNSAASENNIALFTPTHPFYYFSADHKGRASDYKSGCIIFSKYPIINSGKTDFPSEESLIYTDLLKGLDTIRIFTTHLQSFKFKQQDYADIQKIKASDEVSIHASMGIMRKMKAAYKKRGIQTDMVVKELEKSPYPFLICGDFNDVPNSYAYFNIRGDRQDAFLKKGFGIGRSFISLAPTLRIDYILPDNNFEVKQFDMVDAQLSDHIMLLAEIRLKK